MEQGSKSIYNTKNLRFSIPYKSCEKGYMDNGFVKTIN